MFDKKKKIPQKIAIGTTSNLKPIKREERIDTYGNSLKNIYEDKNKAVLKTKNNKKKIKKYTLVIFNLKKLFFDNCTFFIPNRLINLKL
jgi:hypothetical protein